MDNEKEKENHEKQEIDEGSGDNVEACIVIL